MNDDQTTEAFTLERIVLKDLSFETPLGQAVFDRPWKPDYAIRIDLTSHSLADNLWEVVVKATVTAKQDDDVAFLVEAHQAGVIAVPDMERERLREILMIEAPRMIFPYLRESVDNIAAKGGFPPPGLRPPDFAAWYRGSNPPQPASAPPH